MNISNFNCHPLLPSNMPTGGKELVSYISHADFYLLFIIYYLYFVICNTIDKNKIIYYFAHYHLQEQIIKKLI